MTAAVQPRVPAGQSGGGRFAAKPWMFETGPLPYVERPSAAELPKLPPAPVHHPIPGSTAVAVSYDDGANWHPARRTR